jgi:hypothetical protein
MARYVGLGDAISDLRTEIIGLRAKLKAATTVATKEQVLSSLLNRIGQLIAQYKTQGNDELAARWLVEYRGLQDAAAQARQSLSAGEAPSRVLLALDAVGDRALQLTNNIVKGAEGIIGGVATTARMLPLLLPLTLILAAFVIGGGGLGRVLSVRRNPRHRRSRRRRRFSL